MNTFLIDYQQIQSPAKGFSKLFIDYASEGEARQELTSNFFHYDYRHEADYYKLLGSLSSKSFAREALCNLLLRQNREYGVAEEHLQLLEKIRSPRCMTIVTGQQPGLFTGPLYTIYKALSAVVIAERQKAMFPDYDFLPIFWIESDDHDFEESACTSLFKGSTRQEIILEPWNRLPGQMVSRSPIGPSIRQCLDTLVESLHESDYREDIITKLNEFYSEETTLDGGFARTMAWLFKDYPLFFLSPGDPAFKKLSGEVFLRELSTCPEASHTVIAQSSRLEEKGYSTQAKPRTVNLFYINDHNQRQKIEQVDRDFFALSPGKQRYSRHQILEMCGDHPERFSPNVILRAIVQDHVLPVFAYIGGPGEISYLAQYRRTYEHFGLKMPFIIPRGSFTLIEPVVSRIMDKVMQKSGRPSLSRKHMYQTAFHDMAALQKNAIKGGDDHDYDALFDRTAEALARELLALRPSLVQLDPTLEQSLMGTSKQAEKALDTLRQKTQRANRRKHDELLGQIDKSAMHLFPGGVPQERVINIFYYLNKYGPGLIDELAMVLRAHSTESHIALEL